MRAIDYSRLPEHMQASARAWVERGFPHPSDMGSFFRSILSNDLMGAFSHADEENSHAIRNWIQWIYSDAPAGCYGSIDKMADWHARGGLVGKS